MIFHPQKMVFQEIVFPEKALLAGYSALIDALDLPVPLPNKIFATGALPKIVFNDGAKQLRGGEAGAQP